MRTLKVKKVLFPETIISVEMELASFRKMVNRSSGYLVLESPEAYFCLPEDQRDVVFFSLKNKETNRR